MVNKQDLINIRKQLSKILFKFSEVVSAEGPVVIYDGELAEGIEVFTYDAEGAKIALPNGTYNLVMENGETITIEVADGKVFSKSVVTTDTETPTDAPISETKVDMSSDTINKISELENKLNMAFETIQKMNEVLIAFGLQSDETEPEKIEVKDTKVSTKSSATKFFQ